MKVVHNREDWTKNLEDLIGEEVRQDRRTPLPDSAANSDILERLDWLEGIAEGRLEIHRLSKELTDFVADKRVELRSLRRYRFFITGLAVFLMVGVGSFLTYQICTGFAAFRGVITSEMILASFVGASLAFILGVLLVLARGVFGAIKDIDNAHFVPPQVQGLFDAVKKLRGD